MSLVLGFSAFAQERASVSQQRIAKNELKSYTAMAKKALAGKEVSTASAAAFAPTVAQSPVSSRFEDLEISETMMTYYDLQSNGYVANRMYQLPNGSVAISATMSHEANLVASDRGTGYNFYDAESGEFADLPDARVEDFKTGWPSIAPWGETGEILLAHGNGHMQCYTREVAGEGEWEYKGALPDYPEGYPYDEYPTWPRVVTCGENNSVIVAVAALQHSITSDSTDVRTCMWRSEDAENWTISYGPLADLGLGYEVGYFSADDYAMASNGNNVALIYSGCLTNSVWMFKSTDCGLNWTPTRVWEDPYEGISLSDPTLVYSDTLYRPMNAAITIDNNGVVHVALNTFEMSHWEDTQAGYYSYWSGRAVDGILYWNDTQDAPIADTPHEEYIGTMFEEHFATPNPHHAARLWWPIPDDPGYVRMHADTTKWIGYIPMFQDATGSTISWDNDYYYTDNYSQKAWGASAWMALSCDPNGNLACAFSTPCTASVSAAANAYYRRIFVSYYNVDEGYWHQVEDCLNDEDLEPGFDGSESVFTIGVNNTYTPAEFWFGCQTDDKVGFRWGNEPSQAANSENIIYAFKVTPEEGMTNVPESTEAKDVVYNIYPNPVVGNTMTVQSSQAADATITIVNLVGQTVKQFNQHLTMGNNTINVDLKNGIYFCTISANGFDRTVKFVVK